MESDEQKHEAGKSDTESQIGAAEAGTTFQTRQSTQHSECQPNFRQELSRRLLHRLLLAAPPAEPKCR